MFNYAASEAALYAYSECMQVELAPLGVQVTYVMTSNVKTNTVSQRYHLDESSLSYRVHENFQEEQEKAATTGMEPAEFTKELTDQTVLRRKDTV